jgi:predicted RNase H-like HicB family nuclease
MKTEDRYLKFVLWDEADECYVGHCPDLFPWGGVCHGDTEEKVFHQLRILVREEIAELRRAGKEIPMPATRAMREAVLA